MKQASFIRRCLAPFLPLTAEQMVVTELADAKRDLLRAEASFEAWSHEVNRQTERVERLQHHIAEIERAEEDAGVRQAVINATPA